MNICVETLVSLFLRIEILPVPLNTIIDTLSIVFLDVSTFSRLSTGVLNYFTMGKE